MKQSASCALIHFGNRWFRPDGYRKPTAGECWLSKTGIVETSGEPPPKRGVRLILVPVIVDLVHVDDNSRPSNARLNQMIAEELMGIRR